MPDRAFTGASGSRIFFSSIPDGTYSSHDRTLRDQLDKGLIALQQQNLLTIWHDGKLSAGSVREEEINNHLEDAEIILLLLSPEFLDADSCYNQMLHAMQRHEQGEALVIPIFLRLVVGWEGLSIGKLTPLPRDEQLHEYKRGKEAEWCYKVANDLRSLVLERHSSALPSATSASNQQQTYEDTLVTSPPALSSTSIVQRSIQVTEIYDRLRQNDIVALVMTGLSGSGKSVLAAQVYSFVEQREQAHQEPFSDQPLWFYIDETTTPMAVISSLCRKLGRPLPPLHPLTESNLTVKGLAMELFLIVRETPRLIVFDQFDTWLDPQTAQAHPEHRLIDEWLDLLNTYPQTGAGRLLLVSRFYPLGALCHSKHVQNYKVSGLEPSEGIQLLRTGNIPAIEQATNTELSALMQRCQGHAQTLAWLHDIFKRDPSLTISDLLHQPYYENWWIDSRTFEILNAIYTRYLNQEQRELLLTFAVYRKAVPLKDISAIVEIGNSREGRGPTGTQLLLLDLGLLQASGNGFYRIHPTAADFVRGYFEKNDRYRWMKAHSRAARYYQNRFQDIFLLTEFADLLDVVEAAWHLCQAERHDEAYRLIQKTQLFTTLHRLGGNSLLLNLYSQLLAQKNWISELPLEAQLHHEMGEIYSALGQVVEALQEYRRALHLFRQTAQLDRVVEALNNMGTMHRWLHHHSEAQACCREALRICDESPTPITQKGTTLNNLGRLTFEQGKQARQAHNVKQTDSYYHEALDYYEQALTWYHENSLSKDEPLTLNNIGETYQALGEIEQAQKYYWRALQQYQEQGDRRGEGRALNDLGLLYHKLARGTNRIYIKEARTSYKEALRIFREIGDRRQEITALRNLGRFCLTDPELARQEQYRQSIACFFVAKKIAVTGHDGHIPTWVEDTICRDLAHLGTQSYEQFLQEVEAQAEQIVEDMLR